MCMVTENGYKFDCSGRVIPFVGFNLGLLSGEEFTELKNTDVDMVSHMMVKNAILNIENKIDALTTTLDKAIKQSLEAQKRVIIDDNHIVGVIEDWYETLVKNLRNPDHEYSKRFTSRILADVKSFIKDTILTSGNIAWAFTAIFIVVSGIGFVTYLAVKAAQ